jgi:hypothetical protein
METFLFVPKQQEWGKAASIPHFGLRHFVLFAESLNRNK